MSDTNCKTCGKPKCHANEVNSFEDDCGGYLCHGHADEPPQPNCPLVTGLRPCECSNRPRCPKCNYSDHDAAFECDHSLCTGKIVANSPDAPSPLNLPDGSVPCPRPFGSAMPQPELESRSECKHGTLSGDLCERCEDEWMHEKLESAGWKPQPPAETSVDLMDLIANMQPDPHRGIERGPWQPNDAERDEIVTALRERRVTMNGRCCEVRKRHGKIEFYLRLEGDRQTYSYLSLDEAERILGIGGGE